MRARLFLLVACLLPGAAWAGVVERAIRSEASRAFHVQVSTSGGPRVGLMVFHGAVYEKNLLTSVTAYYEPLFKELVEAYPLAVVYPHGRAGRCPWDKTLVCWPQATPWENVGFVNDVAKRVGSEFGVSRWLALGVSNGGYYLASVIQSGEALPFEGIVSCIGGKGWHRVAAPAWTPALTILAGSRDSENLPSARELHADLKAWGYPARAPLVYEEFDGGHEIPEALLKTTLRRMVEGALGPRR